MDLYLSSRGYTLIYFYKYNKTIIFYNVILVKSDNRIGVDILPRGYLSCEVETGSCAAFVVRDAIKWTLGYWQLTRVTETEISLPLRLRLTNFKIILSHLRFNFHVLRVVLLFFYYIKEKKKKKETLMKIRNFI